MEVSFWQSFKLTAKSHLPLLIIGIPFCYALLSLEPFMALITLRVALPVGLLGLIPLALINFIVGLIALNLLKRKYQFSYLRAAIIVSVIYYLSVLIMVYLPYSALGGSIIVSTFLVVQLLWYCYLVNRENEL